MDKVESWRLVNKKCTQKKTYQTPENLFTDHVSYITRICVTVKIMSKLVAERESQDMK